MIRGKYKVKGRFCKAVSKTDPTHIEFAESVEKISDKINYTSTGVFNALRLRGGQMKYYTIVELSEKEYNLQKQEYEKNKSKISSNVKQAIRTIPTLEAYDRMNEYTNKRRSGKSLNDIIPILSWNTVWDGRKRQYIFKTDDI